MALLFILVITLTLLAGCGNDSVTLDTYISAFEEQGIVVDKNEKPLFGMIGAKDGVIFYIDNEKVAIYEYEKESNLNDSGFNFDSVNGRFGLESRNAKAKEIFNSIK